MPTTADQKSIVSNIPHDAFIKSLLPLFSGTQVTIKIGDFGPTFRISKDLLCKQSSYFAEMYAKENSNESYENYTTLQVIDDALTPQSFQILVQWLYQGSVTFPASLKPTEEVSQILEFCRLAEMTAVSGVENPMAERLRAVLADSALFPTGLHQSVGHNIKHITPSHINSASHLPKNHLVRRMFAAAAVEEYLCDKKSTFLASTKHTPSFAADLLREVRDSFHNTPKITFEAPRFIDSISGNLYYIGKKDH